MLNLSRHRLDFIIGCFVLTALVGVVFIALRAANIADISTSNSYTVKIYFDNIGGLAARSPVKSSGVRVGRVKNISYDSNDHIAAVDIVIENRYVFPTDSIFSIVSSNLLGGQYIAIEVGGEDALFENGDETEGNSAIVLEELISKFLFDQAGE